MEIWELTDTQIADIDKRYYFDWEEEASIISSYDLEVSEEEFAENLPHHISDKRCPNCNHHLHAKRPPRNRAGKYVYEWFCPSCGYKDQESCKCSGCISNQDQEKDVDKSRNRSLEDLDFDEKVFVGALLESIPSTSISRDHDAIIIYPLANTKISPWSSFDDDILERLLLRGVISLYDPVTSKPISHENCQKGSDLRDDFLRINIDPNDLLLIAKCSCFAFRNEDDRTKAQYLCDILSQIIITEYICNELKIHEVSEISVKKVDELSNFLASNFSIAQAFYIVNSKSGYVLWREKHGLIDPSDVADTLFKLIKKYGQDMLDHNWKCSSDKNPYELIDESAIESFYFRQVLGLRDPYEKIIKIP